METFGGLIITVCCCGCLAMACILIGSFEVIGVAIDAMMFGDDVLSCTIPFFCWIVRMTCVWAVSLGTCVGQHPGTTAWDNMIGFMNDGLVLSGTCPVRTCEFFTGVSDGSWNLRGVVAVAALLNFTGEPLRKFEYCVASIVMIFGFLTIVTLCNVIILLLKLICTLWGGWTSIVLLTRCPEPSSIHLINFFLKLQK